MADAYQTRAQLVTALGDNTSGAITAQVLRNLLYSSVLSSSSGLIDVGAATSHLTKLPGDLDLNGKNILNGATASLDSGNITSDGSGNLTAVTFVGSLAGTQLNDVDLNGWQIKNAGVINSALTFAHVEWDGAHPYVPNEVVYDGAAKKWYVCIGNNTNTEPPNLTYWTEIAAGDCVIYYGGGIYDSDAGNPSVDVVQIRAVTINTSFCLGSAIVSSGTLPGAVPNDYTPGNNIAMGGAFLTDCNSCFSNLGTMTLCEESVSLGCDGTVTSSFQAIALGNIDHIIYTNNCIGAIGATVAGANDGARIAHSIGIGPSCVVSASNAFALGGSMTNSTASSMNLGFSDATKTIIDINGLRAINTQVYAVGTAYTVTNSSAAVDFGTTDPILTLTTAGKYAIRGSFQVDLAGATFVAVRVLTVKVRRTNNTPGDIANTTVTIQVPIVTTTSETLGTFTLPEVLYTATAGDTLSLYAGLNTAPSAGALNIVAANLNATTVY